MMDRDEALMLIGEINKYNTISGESIDIQRDKKIAMFDAFEDQEYLVNRFGLDYKKLYHNFEGGLINNF